MSDTTEKAKTPAGADPLDFKDEANIRRFVRPNRWVSLDIAGIPVRARARERDFGFFVDRVCVVRASRRRETSPRGRESFPARIPNPKRAGDPRCRSLASLFTHMEGAQATRETRDARKSSRRRVEMVD